MKDVFKTLDELASQEREETPPMIDVRTKVFHRISLRERPSLTPYKWVSAFAGIAAAIFFYMAIHQNAITSNPIDLFNLPEMELTAAHDDQ